MDSTISVIIAPQVEGIDKKCLDMMMERYSVYVLNSYQDADKLSVADSEQLLVADLDNFCGDDDDDFASSQFEFKQVVMPIFAVYPNINVIAYVSDSHRKVVNNLLELGLIHEVIIKPFNIAEFISKIEESRKVLMIQRQLIHSKAELTRNNESFYRFFSSISQKMRTPINAITGYTQLLQYSEMSIKQKEYLNKIKDSINILLAVTNELSDTAKLDLSKMTTENSDFNINNLLTNISNLTGLKAFERNIELVYKVKPGLSSYYHGASASIEQILVNLTSALISYSHDGKIIFFLEQVYRGDEKNHLHARIVSNCLDINDSVLCNCSSVLNGSTDMKEIGDYGSIYDLNVSKKISLMLGDNISFSLIDERTCAIDYDFDLGVYAQAELKSYKIPENIQGMKVLLVDSNIISRDALNILLENMSFRVSCLASGEEAVSDIESASSNPYKLVIISHNPSDNSIVSTIKSIQNNFNIKNRPKIVITSAYSHEQIYRDLDNLSIDGFLAKPIVADVLFETISNLFQVDTDYEARTKSKIINSGIDQSEKNLYSDQLGALDGINQNYGLQRVNGNVSIYRMILLKFYNTNQDTMVRVRNAFAAEKIDDVKKILETTRDLASNIGANDVRRNIDDILCFVEANKLLYAISALEQLEVSFKIVLDSIKTLDKRQNYRDKVISDKDHILINELVNLEIMLRQENYEVDNLINSLSEKLQGTNQKSIFDVVVMYIKTGERFKAIELLLAIKKSIQDAM